MNHAVMQRAEDSHELSTLPTTMDCSDGSRTCGERADSWWAVGRGVYDPAHLNVAASTFPGRLDYGSLMMLTVDQNMFQLLRVRGERERKRKLRTGSQCVNDRTHLNSTSCRRGDDDGLLVRRLDHRMRRQVQDGI